MALKREFVEQSRLISLLGTIIDLTSADTINESAIALGFNKEILNKSAKSGLLPFSIGLGEHRASV